MNLTLTEKAAAEVKRIGQEQRFEEEIVLRIRVVGGGCSGFSHKLDLDEDYDEEKDLLIEQHGVKVAVDKRSALYLDGATVDFIHDLNKHGFCVTNPAAKSICGCGSSFNL